jgi:hypothetical protein
MNDFYERLLSEKKELDERREKLSNFLNSEKVNDIDYRQVSLLNIQSQAMATYSQCLLERIALLAPQGSVGIH